MDDPILYWNDVALEANRISHTNGKNEQAGPTLSSRALAIVHLAMYDAYFGVGNTYGGGMVAYLPNLPPPPFPGGNVVAEAAAVAAAAHATLSALFPSQKDFFDRKHLEAGLQGTEIAKGHAFGLAVAQCLLEDRKDDPDASDKGYAPSMARGAHRPDPDNPAQGYHAPFYGAKSKGFAVSARHTLLPPPRPHDPEAAPDPKYTQAFREVYGQGIAPELMGTLPNNVPKRTADQTLVGIYWGYDGAMKLGTPPRLYNLIIRKAFENRGYTPAQNAQLFALVNVAMGDAGILAWDQKYIHNLWRPVVGVREHDPSMGPAGTAGDDLVGLSDPGWLPLGAPNTNAAWELTPQMSAYPCSHVVKGIPKNGTPPFPAYPSGHATFGAAAFHIAWLYFNRDEEKGKETDPFQDLVFVSEEFNGISQDNKGTVRPRHVRKFPKGMSQLIEENGRSRVYLGVHWVFDAFAVNEKNEPLPKENIGGVPLGTKIADDIFGKKMKKSDVKPRKCHEPGP
jgi:hypothetical protein